LALQRPRQLRQLNLRLGREGDSGRLRLRIPLMLVVARGRLVGVQQPPARQLQQQALGVVA